MDGYRSGSQRACSVPLTSIYPFSAERARVQTTGHRYCRLRRLRWSLGPGGYKGEIVVADNRYYLERSRQRGATHKILYCRLPGWKTDPRRRVKVDILVPPTLGLPEIDAADAFVINDIPVMPLFDLLVMKTQGWWDHRTSHRSDFRAKEGDDLSDIFALLDRAVE